MPFKNHEAELAYRRLRYREKTHVDKHSYYMTNKPHIAARKRVKYKKEREQILAGLKQKRYGLSAEEHQALIELQQDKCAICDRPRASKALAIDHSHLTGEIRGLLCESCNNGLGRFMDDTLLLQRAIDYLLDTPMNKLRRAK